MRNEMTIDQLVERTSDSYSFNRYSKRGWKSSIRVLKSYGFSDEQVEAFLRSKHMRWAADHDGKRKYGYYNGNTLKEYFNKYPQYATVKEVNSLIVN
jgi:hypothetical protein